MYSLSCLDTQLAGEWWGEKAIRSQRYNENSNAWHNAQPEKYTVTNANSLILQLGIQFMFNDQTLLICKRK